MVSKRLISTLTAMITAVSAMPFMPTVNAAETVKGDINGDGNVTVSDMATIRLHLLGKYILSGNPFSAADINGDGKVTVSDMATVRLHLLGKYIIK